MDKPRIVIREIATGEMFDVMGPAFMADTGQELTIYRSLKDERVIARPTIDFKGRFKVEHYQDHRSAGSAIAGVQVHCGYCGQDMAQGSECSAELRQSGRCSLYQQFTATRAVTDDEVQAAESRIRSAIEAGRKRRNAGVPACSPAVPDEPNNKGASHG
jgi:hypothetical protein